MKRALLLNFLMCIYIYIRNVIHFLTCNRYVKIPLPGKIKLQSYSILLIHQYECAVVRIVLCNLI